MNGLNNTPTDFRDMPVNSGIQNSTVPVPGWVYYLSAYRGYFQNFYASCQTHITDVFLHYDFQKGFLYQNLSHLRGCFQNYYMSSKTHITAFLCTGSLMLPVLHKFVDVKQNLMVWFCLFCFLQQRNKSQIQNSNRTSNRVRVCT